MPPIINTPTTLRDVRRKLFLDLGESYGRTKFVHLCQLNNLDPTKLHEQAPESVVEQVFHKYTRTKINK